MSWPSCCVGMFTAEKAVEKCSRLTVRLRPKFTAEKAVEKTAAPADAPRQVFTAEKAVEKSIS